METRHEVCSAEGQPRNILECNPNRFAACCPALSRRCRCVIHSCMQFRRVFTAAMPKIARRERLHRPSRVNDAPMQGLHFVSIRIMRIFMISKPLRGLLRAGESPLSGAAALYPYITGIVMGELLANQGGGAMCCSGFPMLSVSTLWTVFVINFLALGLIWAYVMRSYPKFEAARFWTGSALAAAVGGALGALRFPNGWGSLLPLFAGGAGFVFCSCLCPLGGSRFLWCGGH